MNPPPSPWHGLDRLRSAGTVLLVAVTYLVLGYLSDGLALPPDRAIAIWPPAGFALAMALALGPRAILGVWLGHFAYVWFGHDPTAEGPFLVFALALGIATGAALQALAARWLVTRGIDYPNAMEDRRTVMWFFLAGGPLSCWISTSFGTTALVFAGFTPLTSMFKTWWTWGLGDCLGVMTVAPLVLLFVGDPREAWRPRRWGIGLPLGLALVACAGTFLWVRSEERGRLRHELEVRGRLLASELGRTLAKHEQGIRGWADLVETTGSPAEETFRRYAGNVMPELPGLRTLGWVPPTPLATPATPLSVRWTAPASQSLQARWPDLMADAARRSALEKAMATLKPTATSIQGSPGDSALRSEFLVAAPVRHPGHDGPEGIALGMLSIAALWSSLDGQVTHSQGLHVRWVDITDAASPLLLVSTTARRGGWAGDAIPPPTDPTQRTSASFTFAQRSFRLEMWPTPEHQHSLSSNKAWAVLVLGSLFCALMAGVLLATHRPASA